MSPRVLVASAHYPPHVGGVERYTEGVVHELNRRGYDVDLITSRIGQHPHQPPSTPGPGRLRVAFWDAVEAFGRMPLPSLTGNNLRIFRSVYETPYDLAIIQSHLYVTHGLLVRCIGERTPTVLLGHGSGPVPSASSSMDALIRLYERGLALSMRSKVQATAGVSRLAAQWMVGLGFENVTSVGNATVPNALDPPDRDETAPLKVAYVGRLEPGKGADTAIRATDLAAQASGGGQSIQLTIAGSGSQEDYVGRLAKDYAGLVSFVGPLGHKDVKALLNDSDVFLYPSAYPEGFPTVMLEAAAARCALVTFPVAGSAELLGGTGAGWVVSDMEEAAEVLRRLAAEPELAQAAGKAAEEVVAREYTWSRVVDRVLETVP